MLAMQLVHLGNESSSLAAIALLFSHVLFLLLRNWHSLLASQVVPLLQRPFHA